MRFDIKKKESKNYKETYFSDQFSDISIRSTMEEVHQWNEWQKHKTTCMVCSSHNCTCYRVRLHYTNGYHSVSCLTQHCLKRYSWEVTMNNLIFCRPLVSEHHSVTLQYIIISNRITTSISNFCNPFILILRVKGQRRLKYTPFITFSCVAYSKKQTILVVMLNHFLALR